LETYETSEEINQELHRDQELHRCLLLIFISKMHENTKRKCMFLIIARKINTDIKQELDRGLLPTLVIKIV